MSTITGRIGKKFLDCSFSDSKAVFKEKDEIKKQMVDIWFIYFQRVSKTLKTCDAVLFDGNALIEFTTAQKNIEQISDNATCPVYFGGIDPLPWKRLLREAKKHEWHREDWQHMFEDTVSGSESDSDGDWNPPSESEEELSDDDVSDGDDDEEPVAKRPCRREDK